MHGEPTATTPSTESANPLAPTPDAPPTPRARWHPLIRVALFFAIYFLGVMYKPLFGILCLVRLPAWLNDGQPVVLLGEGWQRTGGALISLTGWIGMWLLFLPLTWLFLKFLDRGTFADIGWRWPRRSSSPDSGGGASGARLALVRLPLWIFGTAGLLGLWLACAALLGDLRFGGMHERFAAGPHLNPTLQGSLVVLASFFFLFLLQGGGEEWVFRGYFQSTLMRRYSWRTSALLSSLIFMGAHSLNPSVTWTGMLNTFLIGLFLALVWRLTGSLWGPMLFHGCWNFFLGTLLSLPVSGLVMMPVFDLRLDGPAWITGGSYGAEGSLLVTLFYVVLITVAWRRIRAREALEATRDDRRDGGTA